MLDSWNIPIGIVNNVIVRCYIFKHIMLLLYYFGINITSSRCNNLCNNLCYGYPYIVCVVYNKDS